MYVCGEGKRAMNPFQEGSSLCSCYDESVTSQEETEEEEEGRIISCPVTSCFWKETTAS